MRAVVLLLPLAVGLAAVGCGGSTTTVIHRTTTVNRTVTLPAGSQATASGGSTADIVARVLPGVVNVKTTDYDGSKGDASGVVIDRRGVIVTNNHVIEGARTVTVTFNDGRHHGAVPAEVVGTAPERDLAILHVGLTDLVPVPLGKSSTLRLGDDVLAIGFPLGLGGPTVTRGIVSGLDRTIRPDNGMPLEGLLQTDAAINPGNSGGALVNFAGQLIGINTAAAAGRTAQSIGFSIAIDQARVVIDEIRNKPAAQRSWIGASLDSINSAASAVQLGLPPDVRGAVVVAVYAGSPAAKAGVREGDVIVSINGATVTKSEDVTKVLSRLNPGDSLTLDLVDQSGPRRTSVTIAKRPATLTGG